MFLYQVYIMLDQQQRQLPKEMEDKVNAEEEANKEKERKRKMESAEADARWCLQQPHEFVQYNKEAQEAEKQAKDAAARELLQHTSGACQCSAAKVVAPRSRRSNT